MRFHSLILRSKAVSSKVLSTTKPGVKPNSSILTTSFSTLSTPRKVRSHCRRSRPKMLWRKSLALVLPVTCFTIPLTRCSVTANIQGSSSEIIVGAKHGFATLNRTTGEMKYIRKYWEEEDGPEKSIRYVHPHARDSFQSNQSSYPVWWDHG